LILGIRYYKLQETSLSIVRNIMFSDNEIVFLRRIPINKNARFILDNIKSKTYPTINEKQYNMASASSTSARSLFIESKMRLADRVQVNVNNIASLARQIQRGSRSSEVISYFSN